MVPDAPDSSWKKRAASAADMINASEHTCSFDSESMWGSDLENSGRPYRLVVKEAFRDLTKSIRRALHSNPRPCPTVTIMASMFPKMAIQGRAHTRDEISKVPLYFGATGCGIYIVSDWQAKTFPKVVSKTGFESANGWHLISFATDSFLKKINEKYQSNELQRLYNLLKIAAPLFLPEATQQITFGDVKCNLRAFVERVRAQSDPTTSIYTFQHPVRYGHALKGEFTLSMKRSQERQEPDVVRQDMFKLAEYLGPLFLAKPVPLADIMCMTWNKSEAVETLARRWFWYTATFTMRPQLTFDAALMDCGEELKVDYLPLIESDIDTT